MSAVTSPVPSTPVPSAPKVRSPVRNKGRLIVAALMIAAAMVFLIIRGLGDATQYFRTADEALAQRHQLGSHRFRIEGAVVPGTIRPDGRFTDFAIAGKGVTVVVHNDGQPVGIFRENIPVVLEGRFARGSNVFYSDRVMVKHSSDYQAKHPDRVSGQANR